MRYGLAVLLAVLATMPGWRAGAAPAVVAANSHAARSTAELKCHCRANGRTYELGERVCLLSPQGLRVAECRMQQNVTSWQFDREDCSVNASLAGPERRESVTR